MTTVEMLDELQNKAKKDEELKALLLAAEHESNPLQAFCKTCQNAGYEIYPMDLVVAGEEFYASMRRSTNGGGENSPMLDGEDDFFELFLASLK